MRHVLLRPFALLLALLCIGNVSAQMPVKPRNTLTLPLAEPVNVEIRLESDALGYHGYNSPGLGLSMVGDAIAAERMRGKEEQVVRPALARLRAGMSTTPRADLLAAAIRSELEATGKLTIGEMRVHDVAHPAPALQPGDDTRNVLLVVCRYEMDGLFQAFLVRLHARYGTRAQVLAADGKVEYAFQHDFTHRENAPRGGYFSFVEDAVRHWEGVGAQALDQRIDAGLRDVAAMLAYELQRKPGFGRVRGKQYVVGPGEYGAIETEHGDRAWVRARSGYLTSFPRAALR